jgi:thiol-disulfide isomerase/thioredoxin
VAVAGQDLAFRDVGDLRVVAIVEDWCKDSRDALPVLDALLAASPGSQLRVVRRDEHPDLMRAYLKDGRFAAIPVFIFLDAGFNELARYVERPDSVTRLRRAEREEIARRDPRFVRTDAKPSAFDEPARSELKTAIQDLRIQSLPQAQIMIATELASVADRIAKVLADRAGARDGSPKPALAVQSSLARALAPGGPLQILDVGDDDCEIESVS